MLTAMNAAATSARSAGQRFLAGESDSFLGKWWQRELNLTLDNTIAGGFSSISYNFGFHGRVLAGETDRSVLFMNRVVSGPGSRGDQFLGKYVYEAGGKFHAAETVDDVISGAAQKGSKATKFGTKIGGIGNVLGIGFNFGYAGYMGLSTWRETGSISQGAFAAGKEFAVGLVAGKVIGGVMAGPGKALLPFVAAGIGVYSVFNAKNVGNQYKAQRSMSSLSGQVNQSTMTRNAYTIRQRSVQSMEFSKFNVMKALGNESSFSSMPKSRYGNNSGISAVPIMGY
jgi:hypothetical protein